MSSFRACTALVILLVAPVMAVANDAGIAWRTDLAAAQTEAQRSGKLVLLHFWTETCGPCKLLETRVFSQPGVAPAVEANYVPVKVNANEAPQLVQAYGITKVPTDVVTSPTGEMVRSFVSPATPMGYLALANEIATSVRDRSGAPYQAMAEASPYGQAASVAANTAQQINSAADSSYQQFKNANVGAPASMIAQPAVDGAAAVGNRYAMAAPTAVMQQPAQQVAAAAPSQASSQANPYASNFSVAAAPVAAPAPMQPAAQQVASAAPAVQPAQPAAAATPQLPAGSPPLGFEGFCPVTMKSEWKWTRGDAQWGAIHRGRTYLFASAVARDTFLASPDEYSPALAGSDPVLAVESRQSVAGTREYALEYRGKFYLFANEQTLNKFWTDADGYADGAERIANTTAGDTVLR
ncbi:MAG: DUF255 domain-containing protein [Lacipirellulaceae bacterium]